MKKDTPSMPRDGETGLWHARSGSYDVVILDLMLPGIDGLSILKNFAPRNPRATC